MAKKKEKITETPNKEADVKAFVEENTGKTLSSADIEKSKKSLKKTTADYYDSDPEKKAARKKQVNDYKEYKARRISDEKREDAKTNVEKTICNSEINEKKEGVEVCETITDIKIIGVEEVSECETVVDVAAKINKPATEAITQEIIIEKPKKPTIPVAPYGYSHMGISYD